MRRWLLALLVPALCGAWGCRAPRRTPPADAAPATPRPAGRLVLLAIDGLDPRLLDRWLAEDRLPAFAALRARGEFGWIRTTDPPTCEAAWTALVTGSAPADSGIAGPWRVDPETYRLLPGAVDVDLSSGPPRVTSRRSGTAFWTALAGAGVRVRVLWAPYEIPPERLAQGEVLAGAGVPDLGGGPGSSLLLSAEPSREGAPETTAQARLTPTAEGWTAELPGPSRRGGRSGRSPLPLRVRREAEPERLVLELPGAEAVLATGEWSLPLTVSFPGEGVPVSGVTRFLALEASEHPRLLAAPVEPDPRAPWFPLSEPPAFAAELVERYGFLPLGSPPGTLEALAAGALGEEAFLAGVADDFARRSQVLLGELDRGDFELLVVFLPTVEQVTRGLWRFTDPAHPRYDEARSLAAAPGFGGVRLRDAVLASYAFVDDLVGRVAARLRPEDLLVLLSDHGMRPSRRAVHLNAWLRREGLLVLKTGTATVEESGRLPGPADIDWGRTQAYALGGAGIRLNLEGREGQGLVEPGDRAERLVDRLAAKLRAWTDDDADGVPVVRRVWVRGRELRGRREESLPDLLIAFEEPYRESDETVAGLVPEMEIEPDRSPLAADHGSAEAEAVPGVFFSTRPPVQADPSLLDVGAAVLGYFGVPRSGSGAGRDLWHP